MNPPDDGASDSAIDRVAKRLASLDDLLWGRRPGAPERGERRTGRAESDDEERVAPGDLDMLLLLNQAGAVHRGALAGPAAPTPARIGRFALVREVGRGGFANVYEAIDTRLHRRVALKVARTDAVPSLGALRRFVREAELAARVVHPHVVTMHEVGEEDGAAFIAEEFCDGGSLQEWLEAHPGPVNPSVAAAVVRAIAEGLHAAHRCGITHRDIKPANVFLATATARALLPIDDARGFDVKLGDFGLCKLSADAMVADHLTQLSAHDDRIGTLVWMAPEQVDHAIGPTGPLTDIYSLGLVLDRMLTGRCRQAADTEAETLRLILLEEAEPVDRVARGVPADLAAVCLKCLARHPRDRYASAAELAVDLGRFLDGRPTIARPLGPVGRAARAARRQPLLAASTVVAMAAIAVGGALWLDLSGKRSEIRRREAELRSHEAAGELRAGFDSLRTADVAGALRHLRACRSNDEGLAGSLAGRWLLRRCHGERRLLLDVGGDRGAEGASRPADLHVLAVSPDGACIAAGRADGALSLARWPGRDSLPTWSHHPAHDEINDVAFSPDGTRVATVGQDGAVHVWSSDDGSIVSSPCLAGAPLFAVAFSPDGTRIAWGGEERRIVIADAVDGEGARTSIAPFDDPAAPSSADDGEIESLVWIDGDLLAASCGRRAATVRVSAGAIERECVGLRGIIGHVELSPDRRRLLCAGTSGEPVLVDVDTGMPSVRLAAHPNWVQGGAFSPDGATIATGCRDGVIRTFDAATGDVLRTFVGHEGRLWDVRFEPGGGLLSAGADGTLREWDLKAPPWSRGAITATLPARDVVGAAIWTDPAGRLPARAPGEIAALVVPRTGESFAIALPSARILPWEGPRFDAARRICLGPPRLAVIDRQTLQVCSLDGDAAETRVVDHEAWTCAWLPDGRLVVGAWDGELLLFDAALGSSRAIDRFPDEVECIDVGGPAHDRIAAGAGGEIRSYVVGDSATRAASAGRALLSPPLVSETVTSVAWSPDARLIAYGTNHGSVGIVEAATGARRGTIANHVGQVRRVRFARDGRVLLSCDAESVRISDVETCATLDEVRPGWAIETFELSSDASGAIDDGLLLVGGSGRTNGSGDSPIAWIRLDRPVDR